MPTASEISAALSQDVKLVSNTTDTQNTTPKKPVQKQIKTEENTDIAASTQTREEKIPASVEAAPVAKEAGTVTTEETSETKTGENSAGSEVKNPRRARSRSPRRNRTDSAKAQSNKQENSAQPPNSDTVQKLDTEAPNDIKSQPIAQKPAESQDKKIQSESKDTQDSNEKKAEKQNIALKKPARRQRPSASSRAHNDPRARGSSGHVVTDIASEQALSSDSSGDKAVPQQDKPAA